MSGPFAALRPSQEIQDRLWEGLADMLFRSLDDRFDHIDQQLAAIARKVDHQMALTAAESTAITQLSTDIDAALTAATSQSAALQGVIDGLNAQLGALQTQDTADQAQVAALTQSVSDLQAVVDGASGDVVAALSGLDQHVQTFGQPAPAPTEPTPAPVVDSTDQAPTDGTVGGDLPPATTDQAPIA